MSAQSGWPFGSAGASQHSFDDNNTYEQARPDEVQDLEPAHAVIGEMARLIRETRGNILAGAGVLGSITIGIALEAGFAARALQPGIFRVINIGLLLGLIFCWVIAVIMLTVAERPTLNALDELRWRTGSPLDPRAGWLTLPPVGAHAQEWTWIRAHMLLAAARLSRQRVQSADTWTYVTAACFVLWTAIVIVGF